MRRFTEENAGDGYMLMKEREREKRGRAATLAAMMDFGASEARER